MFGPLNRRSVLTGIAGAAALGFVPTRFAIGQQAKIKVGLLLSHGGAYAGPGIGVTNGIKLALAERGGKIAGREVEFVMVDDESNPAKGPENTHRLVTGEKVDFLVGPVHSGVAMGMVKVARETEVLTIIPNAGFNAATGPLCAKNIFRTSFSNWQANAPMGKVAIDRGYKNVVTITWKYAAGEEMINAFVDRFTDLGGKVVKQMALPFPDTEFQAHLTEIASLKPDAVYAFFAGSGASKFIKDYAAVGLKSIPLLGPGFLTDGVLPDYAEAAEGILTTLHYADALDNPENHKFRAAYKAAYGKEADFYAVQGYDAGQLMAVGLEAAKGDAGAKAAIIAAMEKAEIKSPRGTFILSKSHNPIQDVYLRQVKGGKEVVLGVAQKAVNDPGTGCKIA